MNDQSESDTSSDSRCRKRDLYSSENRVAAGLALGLLLALGVQAQERSGAVNDNQEIFIEAVQVDLVNVNVFVTDKQGQPVSGLTVEDFAVFEDGEPVSVTNFSAIEDGVGESVSQQIQRTEPDAELTDGRIASRLAAAKTRSPLYLVIYVDNVNIEAVHRARVFRDLRLFLSRRFEPEDKIMLVSYERSLKIKQGFTNNPKLISNALDELGMLSTNSTQNSQDRIDLLYRIEDSERGENIRTLMRGHAQSVRNDLNHSMRSLHDLTESMAGIPGLKALLYVSDGLPMVPGEEFFVAAQSSFPGQSFVLDSRAFDATRKFQQLAHVANTNRVIFYTLDAAGVRVSSAIDVERGGVGELGSFYNALDSATTLSQHSGLRFVASETGGEAIINTNNALPGLKSMVADFRSYYSLGYPPRSRGDGRYHKIRVKVARKDLKVRHREGYRDKSLSERMKESTLARLRWNVDSIDQLSIGLQFEAGSTIGDSDDQQVQMVVEIPLNRVVLIPRGSVHVGKVNIYVAVGDIEKRVAPVQEVPVQIEIPSAEIETALGHTYRYKIQMRMRTGSQRVAVGARDLFSARSSFVSQNISVGE